MRPFPIVRVTLVLWPMMLCAPGALYGQTVWRLEEQTCRERHGTPLGDEDTQPVPVEHEDSWLGRDKLRHLATSVVLTAGCYETGREMGLARSEAQNLAALSALAAGLLKEERDRRKTYFSWKDLVADVVGIALGVAVFTYWRAAGT